MSIRSVPVSVIIPCWRCSETIERAMESISDQSMRPSEVILIDDASGDGTLLVLQQLAARFPPGWVRVIGLEQNGGPGAARNAGWDIALQPWIAFLDADDAWHPKKIEQQMEWIDTHPDTQMCGHDTAVSSGPGNYPDVPISPQGWRVTFLKMLISNRFPTRTVMLRRDLPFRFGCRSVTEDYLLWLEVILAGYTSYRIESPLAVSFRHDFSPGGYSGALWRHERRELSAWSILRRKGLIAWSTWLIASAWSLVKFVRRYFKVER